MPKATTIKTQKMISEGYRPNVAAAAAHSMARRGKLGPEGGYQRKGKKRGPRGAQRLGFEPTGNPKKLRPT
jgi:hypothetical protein